MGGRGGGPRGNGFGSGNRNPNEYGSWDRRQAGPMQDKIETTFTVPSSKCGIIIGKGLFFLHVNLNVLIVQMCIKTFNLIDLKFS